MKESIVDLARRIAEQSHAGQFRRDGVTPYINHPAAVVDKLRGEPDEVVAAAWLHDVLEDTQTTEADLRNANIPEPVIEAVKTMSKVSGFTYGEYLFVVMGNPIARKVKIADMLHNLSDSPTDRQIVKYARGLLMLLRKDC